MIERYETQEMRRIWSEENRFGLWLQVELAVCRAWARDGVIPQEALGEIEAKAGFDIPRIREIEAVTQHDVIAFVSAVACCHARNSSGVRAMRLIVYPHTPM